MLGNFFKKSKTHTQEDLLKELLNPYFKNEVVDEIFESGLDLNWQNEEQEGYLHLCARKNLIHSLKWLARNKAKKNILNSEGETAMFYAVASNSVECIETLIALGMDVDFKNKYQRTPLQEAVISDKKKVLDLLIDKTKDINSVDINKRNIIFDVVSNGNINVLTKILGLDGLNINQIDIDGNTILHHRDVLKNDALSIMLMEAGANPTIKDANGKSFLFYIARKGVDSIPVLQKALSLGYDLNACTTPKNETILMDMLIAISECEVYDEKNSLVKTMKSIVSMGIDLNAKDNNGETALFYTVRHQDIENTQFLLGHDGMDVNEKNNSGETILSIAVVVGASNMDMIATLLKFKADPNIKDRTKKSVVEKLVTKSIEENPKEPNFIFVLNTILENSKADLKKLNSNDEPLFFEVIIHKRFHMLKLFRQYHFDLNQEDIEGNNIIHNIIRKFREDKTMSTHDLNEILSFLISTGINVNKKDAQGRSPLHNAIVEDWVSIIKLLLDSKADINSIDKRGRSLAHCCVWKNDIKNFKLLHSNDSKVLNIADEYGILPINYAAFMGLKELVVKMIEAGAYVNNTSEKNPEIVASLVLHKKNLDELIDEEEDSALIQRNISLLVENMKKEFHL